MSRSEVPMSPSAFKQKSWVCIPNPPASKTLNVFEPLPQRLINFNLKDTEFLKEDETIKKINSWENILGDEGRILVRMSGTEPLLRVMIECKNSIILDKVISEVDSFFTKI